MEIVIKKLGKYRFEKNYIYEEHSHNEYEINYVISGKCIMVVDGNSVTLSKGDCVVVVPLSSHNFIVSGNQSCEIMQLEFSSGSDIFFKERGQCQKLTNCADILEGICCIGKYNKNKECSEYYKKLLELEVEKLFVVISMHSEMAENSKKDYEKSRLRKIFFYIDNNYSENINLNSLAKKHNISSRYLRKLFIESTGISAIEYITALRLEKAKDLLKNSKCSVSHISLDVGYNSCQYFSAIFKNKIGITPKEFRNQYSI